MVDIGAVKGKGWHAKQSTAPHKGKGNATVSPIRKIREINRIKLLLKDHNKIRDLALFTLGINAGLRGSDLLHLRYKDVLKDDDQVVRLLRVVERKTGNGRRIALGTNARNAIKSLLPKDMDELDPGAYLFPSKKGAKAMTIQRLHQLVNMWCKKAGVKGRFGSHTLRKTYGYHQYRTGVDIALLMDMFGHSSQRTTLRYIGIQDEQIDEANLRLNL